MVWWPGGVELIIALRLLLSARPQRCSAVQGRQVQTNVISVTAPKLVTCNMETLIRKYSSFTRGGGGGSAVDDAPFWHCVVITASDITQRKIYEQQIQAKQSRGELPLNLPVHVVEDKPQGVKIGNGGSTLVALSELHKLYGTISLSTKRVLMIHAGGQSKRLISASIMGKVFTAVPISPALLGEDSGQRMYDMLDVCLIKSLPLVERMSPGVFIICPDTFEIYDAQDVRGSPLWHLHSPGFTALAHPSSLSVGRGHGVYVVGGSSGQDDPPPVQFVRCDRVLQKPSVQLMRDSGAIYRKSGSDEEFCYSDSCFYFDMDVAQKLTDFYETSLDPLQCEVDAFGDFLQALGDCSVPDYVNNCQNVSDQTDQLIPTRSAIYQLLNGTPLHLIILNQSSFHHIGTTAEYLRYFCDDDKFRSNAGFSRHSLVTIDDTRDVASIQGCAIHSAFSKGCTTAKSSIVEYCDFQLPVSIGDQCIVSNCTVYSHSMIDGDCAAFKIPDSLYLHTVPVSEGDLNGMKFVTIFLHINDDLKKQETEVEKLIFLGKPLTDATPKLETMSDQFGVEDMFAGKKWSKFCLWEAKLFPVCESMSASFVTSVALCRYLMLNEKWVVGDSSNVQFVSVNDIMKRKQVEQMLTWRMELFEKITVAK